MTANKLEEKARELLAAEMREHYPATADRLLMPSFDGTLPYSTEAAIRAIVRALDTARQSEGMVDELLAAHKTLLGWVERVVVPEYGRRKPMPENLEKALAASHAAIDKFDPTNSESRP